MTLGKNNQAFIDGQNLIMGTVYSETPWIIDWWKLRVYLAEKYNVARAYYFIGAFNPKYQKMYDAINRAGFELVFRAFLHNSSSEKKGNVDTDIIFLVMKKIAEREKFDRVVLVSGDGDYWKMVEYLLEKDKFEKILAPNKSNLSSLYRAGLPDSRYAFLDDEAVKRKIIHEQ